MFSYLSSRCKINNVDIAAAEIKYIEVLIAYGTLEHEKLFIYFTIRYIMGLFMSKKSLLTSLDEFSEINFKISVTTYTYMYIVCIYIYYIGS